MATGDNVGSFVPPPDRNQHPARKPLTLKNVQTPPATQDPAVDAEQAYIEQQWRDVAASGIAKYNPLSIARNTSHSDDPYA